MGAEAGPEPEDPGAAGAAVSRLVQALSAGG
jgi:hypothetical protein